MDGRAYSISERRVLALVGRRLCCSCQQKPVIAANGHGFLRCRDCAKRYKQFKDRMRGKRFGTVLPSCKQLKARERRLDAEVKA